MKFTYQIGIAALFGSFTVAAPATTLCLSLSNNEVVVNKPVGKHFVKDFVTKDFTHIAEGELCWKDSCFEYEPVCPPEWYGKPSKEAKDCWTCCRSTPDEDFLKLQISASHKGEKPGL